VESKELKDKLARISRRLHIDGCVYFYFDTCGYEGWLNLPIREILKQFPTLAPTISSISPTGVFIRCVLADGAVVTFIVRGEQAKEIHKRGYI